MGGSKNKSPAQKDKSQSKDAGQKKSKKSEKSNATKTVTSVIIDESKAIKIHQCCQSNHCTGFSKTDWS